jgi:glucan 1,3-beta-glucosidase
MRFGLLAAVAALIAVFWVWMGRPVAMPILDQSDSKLPCLSYTPFRGSTSPLEPDRGEVSVADIEDDLARLASATRCVRTYSAAGFHLDRVAEIAARHGLEVLQGIWLSPNPKDNRLEIEAGIALANKHPSTIRGLIVGNEVLLRRDLPPDVLAATIREVKSRVRVPVTYADVWEYWLMNRPMGEAVDFITVHMLPFWENEPTPVDRAAGHAIEALERVRERFPGKRIMIGETGWPSQGRMREGALPSPANQARFVHEVAGWVASHGADVNFIEAFDQPWKRTLEGTVGGYWGIFGAESRAPKFRWGEPVSNHPHGTMQAFAGIVLALAVFAAAWREERRRAGGPLPTSLWLAISVVALVPGLLAGLALESLWLEANGPGGWLRLAGLGTLALTAPLAAVALARGLPLPGLSDVLAPSPEARPRGLGLWLGAVLVGTTLAALQAAVHLTFAPRYVDFPYAALTAAVVPLLAVALHVAPAPARWTTADTLAIATLVGGAAFVSINEGFANWQAQWLAVALVALAVTLGWPRRARRPG